MLTVAALYHFTRFPDPAALKPPLARLCCTLGVRGTLAAWEAKLAPLGFVRVHRSRIVNRARIRAVKPTPSGDIELTLDDGGVIAGSRRYREGLSV